MKIMIIGDGKIGSVLAEQLSKEKHEVTLVDRSGVRLDQSNNELDVMVVEGDGASREVQLGGRSGSGRPRHCLYRRGRAEPAVLPHRQEAGRAAHHRPGAQPHVRGGAEPH